MKYIGIDLGTSGIKLLLVSSTGKILKTVNKALDLLIPKPLWTEQDPGLWYEQTLAGLKELISGFEHEIRAISFSGQMHGLVILDAHDRVLRNALLWNDQRTSKEVDYLNNVIGREVLLQETGNIALTGLTAPKLLWVRENEPEIFQRIAKIMLPKDYLVYKFSGVFATDISDVSGTLYYDVGKKIYSKKMLDILGISEEQLPQLFASSEVVGLLRSELMEQLGIKNPVKIVIGGGDQAVGAIGTGVVNAGECSISLGTSGAIFVANDEFTIDERTYLQSYAHCNGKYHLMGVTLNAAGSIKWWLEVLKEKNYDNFFAEVDSVPIEDRLYFLPYLNGERAPINDAQAKGVFIGLRIDHQREHLGRAIVEGVTFSLKQTFELIENLGVKIRSVRITGGGAKSKIWAQMLADIFDLRIETIQSEEGPAYGAAILAMVGDNLYPSVAECCKALIAVKDVFLPDAEKVAIYRKKFEIYKKIYPQIKSLYQDI